MIVTSSIVSRLHAIARPPGGVAENPPLELAKGGSAGGGMTRLYGV